MPNALVTRVFWKFPFREESPMGDLHPQLLIDAAPGFQTRTKVFAAVSSQTTSPASEHLSLAWYIGAGFRYIPGTHRGTLTADQVARRCQTQWLHLPNQVNERAYSQCLVSHDVQGGAFYQPASHYWTLQWGESAIYVVLAAILFGVALWAVRRWRA
jgi:hypothetical protein